MYSRSFGENAEVINGMPSEAPYSTLKVNDDLGKARPPGRYHPLPAPALGMLFERIPEVAAVAGYAVTDPGRLAKELESGKPHTPPFGEPSNLAGSYKRSFSAALGLAANGASAALALFGRPASKRTR